MITKAVFFDRDGVINYDAGYHHKYEDTVYLDGIFDLVKYFQLNSFYIFVITNQSGVKRGYYELAHVLELHNKMDVDFDTFSAKKIDKWYICPHLPSDNCKCRKPKPGMILNAVSEFNIDLQNSVLIGDKYSDYLAGKNADLGQIYILENLSLNIIEKNIILNDKNAILIPNHNYLLNLYKNV